VKADAILRAGLDTLVARGVKRDQPDGERSMPRIVRVFEAITGIRLTEREGLLFMVSMKLVREGRGAPDADDYIDLANYVALCGEAALATGKESLQVEPAATAHAELQDLLRQRYEQLGTASVYGLPDGTLRYRTFCRGCGGTGNCAIDPAHDIRCPACHGEGVRYWIACPDCARTGFTPGSGGDSATFCPTCRGKGELPATRPERGPYTLDPDGTLHGLAGTHNIQDVPEGCCPICAGTGYANQDTRELCHTCGGTGAD
jgi:hypothetical protein